MNDDPTSFWLIRHALVEENARAILYGTMDVELCPATLLEQAPMYRGAGASACRAPRPGWSRRCRARAAPPRPSSPPAIPAPSPTVEPDLIEQHLGEWQGLPHAELPPLLTLPKHAFWPLAGHERPPGGETHGRRDRPRRRGAGAARRAATPARMWWWSATAARSAPPWRIACASSAGQRAAPVGAEPVADPAGAAPGRLAGGLRQRTAGILSRLQGACSRVHHDAYRESKQK